MEAKVNTAISRKVVGKSARDNPKRYCGWFRVHCFSKKFQRMAREAMNVCLRVLKESNKSRFDSYSVRKSALIISHITFRDCRVHSFFDNLSRNSCIQRRRLFPYWKFGLNVLFWEITKPYHKIAKTRAWLVRHVKGKQMRVFVQTYWLRYQPCSFAITGPHLPTQGYIEYPPRGGKFHNILFYCFFIVILFKTLLEVYSFALYQDLVHLL